MAKYFVNNIAIVVTDKCNLNCGHCLRGQKQNKDISKEVIDAIFEQVRGVSMLNICGGEPLLALDKIEYLFNKIIENKVYVEFVAITINGTIYNKKFEELLEKMNTYLQETTGGMAFFAISLDEYHLSEMKRLKQNYQKKFFCSKYFWGLRKLDKKLKLFREGNAVNLLESKTIPLRAVKPIICDISDKYESISHIIGPLICINTNGTITEDNTSIKNQDTIYNYGNILTDDLVLALQSSGFKTVKYEWLFNLLSKKEANRYLTYKK